MADQFSKIINCYYIGFLLTGACTRIARVRKLGVGGLYSPQSDQYCDQY